LSTNTGGTSAAPAGRHNDASAAACGLLFCSLVRTIVLLAKSLPQADDAWRHPMAQRRWLLYRGAGNIFGQIGEIRISPVRHDGR